MALTLLWQNKRSDKLRHRAMPHEVAATNAELLRISKKYLNRRRRQWQQKAYPQRHWQLFQRRHQKAGHEVAPQYAVLYNASGNKKVEPQANATREDMQANCYRKQTMAHGLQLQGNQLKG
jgi:hypothetical protein